MPRYLADSSIWAWARTSTRPDIRDALADRFERGEIVTCAPVILEVMHRARTLDQHEAVMAQLFEPLERLPLDNAASARALEVQRALAGTTHGNHLRPPIDFLIAAVAEAASVVLWAFDKDLKDHRRANRAAARSREVNRARTLSGRLGQ